MIVLMFLGHAPKALTARGPSLWVVTGTTYQNCIFLESFARPLAYRDVGKIIRVFLRFQEPSLGPELQGRAALTVAS